MCYNILTLINNNNTMKEKQLIKWILRKERKINEVYIGMKQKTLWEMTEKQLLDKYDDVSRDLKFLM